jgi:hypothetical protein
MRWNNRLQALLLMFGAALAVIVGGSVVAGRWSRRGAAPDDDVMRARDDALGQIPKLLGDWQISPETGQRKPADGPEAGLLDESTAGPETPRAANALRRRYRHGPSDKTVWVYVLCGEPRSVTGHTPDDCAPQTVVRMASLPVKCAVRSGDDTLELSTAAFVEESPTASRRRRLFWSYTTADGPWTVPDWPAAAYGRARLLAKVYLICDEPVTFSSGRSSQPPEDSLGLQFAGVFLPQVKRALFSP